ncbi:VPS27 [[Candida] subhashii]|uniref:Vacuolar protein sorting-associated protein 27 n=1 Tax=[Candida] subhashii TaxID=561895 RepID=A0A8J5UIU3_9ASCO|nr:VPS27 [[Candida] subhashii]KAG7661397.1 VPS27 [[Candida] subhashii]
MAWFGGSSGNVSTVLLDNKISQATSESIPNGELDLPIALEITDMIRSKNIPAKQSMRALKKRLTLIYSNPNLITSTLKLIDLCIKNCGFHFLIEIANKEFIDYLIDFIFKVQYNIKDYQIQNNEAKLNVGKFILSLLKQWKIAFADNLQLSYVEKVYNQLVNEGYQFPDLDTSVTSKFVDSEVPPDWIDSDSCMVCYTPFSMMNRKHHCRACGGVFCQSHSANNVPLVELGITEPVRVCDNCLAKQKVKSGKHKKEHSRGIGSYGSYEPESRSINNNNNNEEDEDEQLRRAIELSLQDSSIPAYTPPAPVQAPPPQPSGQDEEEDEDLKAAIAASLQEYESQQKINNMYQQQQPQSQPQQPEYVPSNPFGQPQEPESDLYNISYPQFGTSQQQSQQQQQYQPNQAAQQQYQSPQQTQQQPAYTGSPFQQQQQQPQAQAQPQAQPSQQENLSQAEEEQINLFITLMNNLRNDPKKQANIMYDQDLNELHSKIIKLKPKVNKSLRNSIEKYDIFMEMNNKISTISRLYDQFLESKLSMAYGNHYISPAVQNVQAAGGTLRTGLYPNYTDGQGISPQVSGYGRERVSPQVSGYAGQQQPAQAQQNTGYRRSSQEIPDSRYAEAQQAQQSTAYRRSSQEIPYTEAQQTGGYERQQQQQSQPPQQQSTGFYASYPQESYSTDSYNKYEQPQPQHQPGLPQVQVPTPTLAPCEADLEEEVSNGRTATSSTGPRRFSQSIYPEQQQKQQQHTPSSSSNIVYPTGEDYLPRKEEDTYEVSLPHYPPPEDLQQQLPVQTYVRRASTSLPENAVEDANMKYPSLENVEKREQEEEEERERLSSMFPRVPNNSTGGELQPIRTGGSRKSPYVPEPEPLIEL